MKECRFTQRELVEAPPEPILGELYLKNKLRGAGFDLNKTIYFHIDVDTNEYVYTQENP